jgi:hypothetical protein
MGRNWAEATKALLRRSTRSVAALVAAEVGLPAPFTAEPLPFEVATVRECLPAVDFEDTVLETVFFEAVLFEGVPLLAVTRVAVANAALVWVTACCPTPNANANIRPLLIDTLNSTSPTRHRLFPYNAL